MDQWSVIVESIKSVIGLAPLLWLVVGILIGIVVGGIPGLSPLTGAALMLPVTYGLSPELAIVLFLGIFMGGQYGNSIPAVLIGLPGSASAAITTAEGYVFQKMGRGEEALGVCLLSSVVGQFLGGVITALFLLPFTNAAVNFLFPEVFALGVLGIMATAGLSGDQPIKGLLAGALGLALTTIGADPVSGRPRFSFGNIYLEGGLDSVAVILGLLIVGELMYRYATSEEYVYGQKAEGMAVSWFFLPVKPWLGTIRTTLVGTVIGFFTGVLPGAGGTVGSILGYHQSKPFAREPHLYGGKGSLEALAAADAANNANQAGAVIPSLGLGIPGSAAMLVLMTALMIHGIMPGPALFQSAPGSIHATIGALLVGPLLMMIVGAFCIRPSLYFIGVSPEMVRLGALLMSLVGVYSLRWSMFDVYVAVGAGFLSFLMRCYNYPVVPAALGVMLGSIIEDNFRRGLVMSYNSFGKFFSRVPVIVISAVGLGTFLYSLLSSRRTRQGEGQAAPAGPIGIAESGGSSPGRGR